MEDRSKYRTPSGKQTDENIVELTKEMALSNQNDGDIIELTKSVDAPDELSTAATTAAPAEEAKAPAEEPVRIDPVEKDPPRQIEDEVDAAFESVQSEPGDEMAEKAPDEQLFDQLSEITERVDEAVERHETAEILEPEETAFPASEPDIQNDDAIAADAAVFEAAMGEAPTGEMGSDLTDVDAPADEPATDDLMDDEEFIELTDIVDPEELKQAQVIDSEEEEILELTDIVDPAELYPEANEREDILELTDIVDPDAEDITAGEISAGEVDMAMDDVPALPLADEMLASQDTEFQAPPTAETDAIADMFMDEMMIDDPATEETMRPAAEKLADTFEPSANEPDEDQEQVIQLSDVLGQSDKDERIPIEEIKMGAEEDLAEQPVSLEREEAANALGLNLDMQQKIEAAVEHLLETKYADAVQRLIADAVDQAVAQKMASIKRSFRDDDDTKV